MLNSLNILAGKISPQNQADEGGSTSPRYILASSFILSYIYIYMLWGSCQMALRSIGGGGGGKIEQQEICVLNQQTENTILESTYPPARSGAKTFSNTEFCLHCLCVEHTGDGCLLYLQDERPAGPGRHQNVCGTNPSFDGRKRFAQNV